jgi:hypothetical protein
VFYLLTFPELSIKIKGEGKQQQEDKNFYKKCEEEVQKQFQLLHTEYMEAQSWINDKISKNKSFDKSSEEGYSEFFKKIVPIYMR